MGPEMNGTPREVSATPSVRWTVDETPNGVVKGEIESAQTCGGGYRCRGLVAMGALTVVFSDAPGAVSEGPTLGETTTVSVAPTELATTFVTPPVTAEVPDGFGP